MIWRGWWGQEGLKNRGTKCVVSSACVRELVIQDRIGLYIETQEIMFPIDHMGIGSSSDHPPAKCSM